MNKKIFIFGILGLLMFSLASAALVNYLSNTVEVSASVESPISLQVNNGNEVDFGTIYGSESVNFTITETIHVDEINSNLVITISEEEGNIDSCEEISEMKFSRGTNTYDITNECSREDIGGEFGLVYDLGEDTYTEGERDYLVEVTFAAGALGNYKGEVQHLI